MKIVWLEDKVLFIFKDKEIIMKKESVQQHHLEYMTYYQLCDTGKETYQEFMEEVRK